MHTEQGWIQGSDPGVRHTDRVPRLPWIRHTEHGPTHRRDPRIKHTDRLPRLPGIWHTEHGRIQRRDPWVRPGVRHTEQSRGLGAHSNHASSRGFRDHAYRAGGGSIEGIQGSGIQTGSPNFEDLQIPFWKYQCFLNENTPSWGCLKVCTGNKFDVVLNVVCIISPSMTIFLDIPG